MTYIANQENVAMNRTDHDALLALECLRLAHTTQHAQAGGEIIGVADGYFAFVKYEPLKTPDPELGAESAVATGWQPLRTAPRDGSMVMLAIPRFGPGGGQWEYCPARWMDMKDGHPLEKFWGDAVSGIPLDLPLCKSAVRWMSVPEAIRPTGDTLNPECAAESAVANRWQPIDTAPRDGTELLLSDGKRIWVGEWWDSQEFRNGKLHSETKKWMSAVICAPEPLFWQELPALPQPVNKRSDQAITCE